MNITKEDVDALNAVITVDIATEDYQTKVTKILQDYRKKADIPGFRKGHVPMGMVKKQYGKSVMIDEVNKLLQESLNNFLVEEKIDILGNPLPRVKEDFSWDTETFSFEFELGLAPEFTVDLSADNKIIKYNIIADDSLIDKEVENLQSRYGKISSIDKAKETSNVTGTFTFVRQEKEISHSATISLKDIKDKANLEKIINAKVGDVVELNTKGLFNDDSKLRAAAIGLSDEDTASTISEVYSSLVIEEITEIELAELNQELFGKLFTDGSVKSVAELRSKIKEDSEKQFKRQTNQQLLTDITNYLVENTKFDLPAEFLQKWLTTSDEDLISKEQTVEEYEEYEKDLRLQLIHEKILEDNNIKLYYQELVDYTKEFIRVQMAQFGNTNPEEEELDNISNRILGNPEEAKHLKEELIGQKMITFYKDNITFKTKEVSFEEYVKDIYK